MDAYQRFPKQWKTLGVRWPKRHGVTAPLGITQQGGNNCGSDCFKYTVKPLTI